MESLASIYKFQDFSTYKLAQGTKRWQALHIVCKIITGISIVVLQKWLQV